MPQHYIKSIVILWIIIHQFNLMAISLETAIHESNYKQVRYYLEKNNENPIADKNKYKQLAEEIVIFRREQFIRIIKQFGTSKISPYQAMKNKAWFGRQGAHGLIKFTLGIGLISYYFEKKGILEDNLIPIILMSLTSSFACLFYLFAFLEDQAALDLPRKHPAFKAEKLYQNAILIKFYLNSIL